MMMADLKTKHEMKRLIPVFFTIVLVLQATNVCGQTVANMQKLDGVVHVKHASGAIEMGHDGFEVVVGDIITTENESSVMLFFTDNSQLALRSGSIFQVKAFHYDEAKPAEDNLAISLIKGGLRTLTGFIGKRGNRDAYRLESATATMGIRGTDYTVRLCEADCQTDQEKNYLIAPLPSEVIGRIAELQGELSSVRTKGKTGAFEQFQAFFVNDELHVGSNSHALLIMTDGTRILLLADSVLKINQYFYEQAAPQSGHLVLELIQGGARIVSGQINDSAPENFQVLTKLATLVSNDRENLAIDIKCGQTGKAGCDGEQSVKVRHGKVLVNSANLSLPAAQDASVLLAGSNSAPVLAEKVTVSDNDDELVPENVPVDMKVLFGMDNRSVPTGLYAAVNDGRIVLLQSGNVMEINKGESGFAPEESAIPLKLSITPAFLDYDPQLSYVNFVRGLCE
jgi:hypothetical protein